MAKKRAKKNRNVEELADDVSAETDDDIIEFDDSVDDLAALALAESEDEEDDDSTDVDASAFLACDALEGQMGGFDAIAAAFSEPTERVTLGLENIVGFGIGENMVGGRYTGDVAVKVYVAEKAPLKDVSDEAVVPGEIGGYPTDLEEVGEIYADSFRGRHRPAPGGSSVGHTDITAGTHGCLVVRTNNHLCCLSNNHVLANSNSASNGDPIIQPGPADGGRMPRDRIGRLEDFVSIDFSGQANEVDAAVCWTSFRNMAPRHHCYNINPRPVMPRLNMLVRKCGRTTQHTLGLLTAVGVSVRVNYRQAGIALFRRQLQIRGFGRDFSRGGDSGSLIVTAGSKRPVGLLFAGGGGVTFGNPIQTVISRLAIRRFVSP